MDDISPTLILINDVKTELERGISILSGVQKFLDRNSKCDLHYEVIRWRSSQINASVYIPNKKILSTQKTVISILSMGCSGAPILEKLKLIESDLIDSSEDIIQNHIQKLPLLMLIPLMLFIFPAIFLILLGPLLLSFL